MRARVVVPVVPVVLLTLLAAACGKDRAEPWPPEVNRISDLELDETQMTAEVAGSIATISVVLEARGQMDRPVSGVLKLELLDVSGEVDLSVSQGKQSFEVGRDPITVEVRLGGIEANLERDQLARYVIKYQVKTRGGEIYGRRDLWVALPKAELQLLAPTELPAGGNVYARVFARDAATGAPLQRAQIDVFYTPDDGTEVRISEGLTDAAGAVVLTLTAPSTLSTGTLRVHAALRELTAEIIRPMRVSRDHAVLLSTDKPRYQPGQTIHLRALALSRVDKRPASGSPVQFEVADAKGNKIFRQTVIANSFGIAATTLGLANEVNFGNWTVRATAQGSTTEAQVVVERYSLPKFKVEVAAERPYYRPGELIRGTVNAFYFFGRAVDGSVLVEAQLDGRAIATAQGQLVDGGFAFELPLPDSMSASSGATRVQLAAHVTDSAAQSVDGTLSVPVSLGDLEVAVLTHGQLAAGVPNEIIVAVTDPTGTPVAATVEIGQLATVNVDDTGIGTFDIIPTGTETALTVVATAADGRTVTKQVQLGRAATEALVLRTDKSVYTVGDVAQIDVLSTLRTPRTVAIDVAASGRVVVVREVSLTDGRGSLTLEITDELAGVAVVQAFYAGPGGKIVSDSRTLFVDANRDLVVTVTTPSSMAPGEVAVIELQVTDRDGVGVPAAIGVAIVDRAVFALSPTRPGDEALRLAFGSQTPAPIAGHAIEEVVLGTGEAREAAARLLFAAAGGVDAYGIDANTYREELAGVRALLQPRFSRTVQGLIDVLAQGVTAGVITEENALQFIVSRASRTADVFGKPLTASIVDSWNVEIASWGPDEVEGSADDQARQLSVWDVLYTGKYYRGGGGGGWNDGDLAMADGAPEAGMAAPGDPSGGGTPGASRVRSYFPETLLVAPSVITDGAGRAMVEVTAADSITSWKVTASASSADGRLGGAVGDLVVFQDFFVDVSLPPTLTRGDEMEIPVAVYSYLDVPLTVTLQAVQEPWFELLSAPTQSISLQPGEVRGTTFRIRANGVGAKGFTVQASAGTLSDAVRRSLLVEPGGERIEQGISGRLEQVPVSTTIQFPANAIPGSESLSLRVYPGVMAQTVEGMDAILSEPHGCFEQSTASTWPNVMVAGYMRESGTGTPETMDRAMDYIQKGYQLLVSYESPSGGFNWWGNSDPGNKLLTAMGIQILRDMDGLIEVDEAVIARHASWLAAQQQADGSWPKGDALHMGNEFLSEDEAIVTSYAVQALSAAGGYDAEVQRGVSYLDTRVRAGIDSPFTLAISARALARTGNSSGLQSLYGLASVGTDGQFSWGGPDNHSWTGATGRSAGLETTAVAAQAFLAAGTFPDAAQGALKFLAENKDRFGTWSQTQATVQALRAFTTSLQGVRAPDVDGTIVVRVDGQLAGSVPVTAADSDVVRYIDLSAYASTGTHVIEVEFVGTGQLMYQLNAAHHLAWDQPRAAGGIGVEVTHSARALRVGETDQVTVKLDNLASATMDQILVKVGLAPGLTPVSRDLDQLVAQALVSRWERSPTGVVLYVNAMSGNSSRSLGFAAVATLVGELEAPASVAYGYYNPDQQAVSPPASFIITD